MARTRVYVDEMTDTAYLAVSSRPVARTVEVAGGVYLDLSADGSVLGVELIDPPTEAMDALRRAATRDRRARSAA